MNRPNKLSLLQAVQAGDTELVQSLLAQGAHVNEADHQGNTPLIIACKNGYKDIVDILLSKNAQVSLYNEEFESPLILASKIGNMAIVKALVAHGASPNEKIEHSPAHEIEIMPGKSLAIPSDYVTPLILATTKGHADIARYLLENGADYSVGHYLGITALHYAAWFRFPEIVKILINHGADVNIRAFFGETPLWFACAWSSDDDNGKKRIEIVQFLLHHKADPTISCGGVSILESFSDRDFIAGDFEIIPELIAHGSSFFEGVDVALEKRYFEIVKKLIEKFGNQVSFGQTLAQVAFEKANQYYLDTQDPEYLSIIEFLKFYLS